MAVPLSERREREKGSFRVEGECQEHGMFEIPEDTMNATGHQIPRLGAISKYSVPNCRTGYPSMATALGLELFKSGI